VEPEELKQRTSGWTPTPDPSWSPKRYGSSDINPQSMLALRSGVGQP